MYTLYLCCQYLFRRGLAFIAAVSVGLCVFMVLTVVSIFDGFVKNIEDAAKGLYGDVSIEPASLWGIARYDEFIKELEREVPEVAAATPVIYSYGLLRIGTSYTETVQICGIRLPQRLEVSAFEHGFFVQDKRPDASFDPPLAEVIDRTAEHVKLIEAVSRRERARSEGRAGPDMSERLHVALGNARKMIEVLEAARQDPQAYARQYDALRRELSRLRGEQDALDAQPEGQRDEARLAALAGLIQDLEDRIGGYVRGSDYRAILSVGIGGLSFRTPKGEIIRVITPGRNVVLWLLPVGRGSFSGTFTPSAHTFTVIDDARTGVFPIDSRTVYVPFDTLQRMAEMTDPDSPSLGRCSQIHVRVKPRFAAGRRLGEVRDKVEAAWRKFHRAHPEATQADVNVRTAGVKVQEWVGAIQAQRTMTTIMFGIISFVSVLLIFAIFYMIVAQKTRDIGVVRAVGGSAPGVARIFLIYGAFTGVLGSALGLVGGYYFVRHINAVQDAVDLWFGFRVWRPEVFLFDKIPNQVDWSVATVIALWAVASGLIGALIPAVRAATLNPVEALRYE